MTVVDARSVGVAGSGRRWGLGMAVGLALAYGVTAAVPDSVAVATTGGAVAAAEPRYAAVDSAARLRVARIWPLRHGRGKRPPVVVPDALRNQAFAIEQSSDGHAVVDLERAGVDPTASAPESLQLLDGRGVRIARRVAVRKLCATACGQANSAESCHFVGDYEFTGRSLEQFALAFDGSTDVQPHALERTPAPRPTQLAELARIFHKVYVVPENVYGARWVRSGSGPKSDWIEEATHWQAAPGGRLRAVETPTGARFASCSLVVYGEVTVIRCPQRHTIYVDNRFIGMNDEFELGPSVRYSADIDGTLVYVVLLKKRDETKPVILFRARDGVDSKDPGDAWYKVDASVAHGAC